MTIIPPSPRETLERTKWAPEGEGVEVVASTAALVVVAAALVVVAPALVVVSGLIVVVGSDSAVVAVSLAVPQAAITRVSAARMARARIGRVYAGSWLSGRDPFPVCPVLFSDQIPTAMSPSIPRFS
jgi:hypothetical protein